MWKLYVNYVLLVFIARAPAQEDYVSDFSDALADEILKDTIGESQEQVKMNAQGDGNNWKIGYRNGKHVWVKRGKSVIARD